MASDSDSDIDELLIFAYFHTHPRTLRQLRAIWITRFGRDGSLSNITSL